MGASSSTSRHANRWFRMPRNLGHYGLGDGSSWPEHHDYMADAIGRPTPTSTSPLTRSSMSCREGHAGRALAGLPGLPGLGVRQTERSSLRRDLLRGHPRGRDATPRTSLIHETGHILGLPDLYDVPNPVFWTLFRFSGGWDMMSWNEPGGHFLAWEKWKLGWLDPSQLTCLDGPGELTTTITPLERAGGLKAIVVPMGVSSAYRRRGAQANRRRHAALRGRRPVYSVDASVLAATGRCAYSGATRRNGDTFNRCGPLYNAPFDKAKRRGGALYGRPRRRVTVPGALLERDRVPRPCDANVTSDPGAAERACQWPTELDGSGPGSFAPPQARRSRRLVSVRNSAGISPPLGA